MALKYLSNIDLGGLEIQNAKPYVITSTDQTNLGNSLGTGNEGQMYYNSTTDTFLIWKGSSWLTLDGAGDISSVGLTADDGNSISDSSGAVNFTISGETGISTKASGSTIEIDLDDTAVTAGTYGSSTQIPNFTVDAQGRITNAGNNGITVGNASITIDGGTDLEINTGSGANGVFTTNQSSDETITLDHSSVSRTNTTGSAQNPEFGESITAITAISSSTTGHVTAVTTTQFNLPSLGTGETDALAGNTVVDNVSNGRLLTALANLESSGGTANEEIVIGLDSGDTIKFTGSVKMEENSSFLAQQFTFEDPTSGKPLVVLKNTNDDAAGSTLRFTKDTSNSAADDDEIGQIEFKHDDSGNTQHLYASIQGFAKDVTANDEIGKVKIGVSTGHTNNAYHDGIVIEGHSTDERVDVTIGNGTGSVTTIAGDLTVTGTTTTVNSTTVDIADKNIKVAKNVTTSASADGSGITFSNWSSAPTLTWNHSNSYLTVNKDFHVAGNITLSGTVDGIDIYTDVTANNAKVSNVTTNLSNTADGSKLRVHSSDGNDTDLPAATTNSWGVMTDEMYDTLAAAQNASNVSEAIDATTKVVDITGNGSTTSFDCTHNWSTRLVKVEVIDYGNNGSGATYATVYTDVTRPNDAYVTVTFAVAPSSSQDYKVLLHKITA